MRASRDQCANGDRHVHACRHGRIACNEATRAVDPASLADFPDYVGDTLATNPNIGAARIDAIVARVRTLADDLVVSHL